MQRPSFFLRTKLMPPRPVADLLPRPRLIGLLEGNLQAPLTLVAADAGCGKTTLVADFIRRQSRSAVWYQLDHTDAEPAAFLGYLTHGIRSFVSDFGDAILDYIAEANEDLLRTPERAADLFINEILESLEQPLIIVLDDYHHIGRETVVHRIVDRVLQYSSDLVHFMITTRDMPPLAMMRRRAQSSVLVLTRDDLLFTDDEVRGLFRETLGTDLAEAELEEYRDRTHGWVTALQLVRQVVEQERHSQQKEDIDLVEMLKRSERDIFDYFAEEVFTREPPAIQSLLMSVSLLESLPLETCSMLFPDLRCATLLPELSQKNVFLTVSGDGLSGEEYRLHPLFREFLLRRMRSQVGREGLSTERKRIASVYVQQNDWQKALPFLIDAEDFDGAARLIGDHGGDLIGSGSFITLDTYSAQVPLENLRRHPISLLHVAELARIQGNADRAVQLLGDAIELFAAAGNVAAEAEALHSLASIERRRGDLATAVRLLDRAEALAADSSETLLKCANTRGLCLIGEGKGAEAEQQFRFALDLAEKQRNRHYQRLIMHNLALPPGFRGDFGEALKWFRRIFRDDTEAKQLPQEAIGHLNIARLHMYRGEFEDTARHLERSLEVCQLFNMRALLPEIFEAYANYYRETGDPSHADEYYERAEKAYEDMEIDVSTKEFYEERARFLIGRGDLRRARAVLGGLIEARIARSKEAPIQTALLGIAQIDLLEGMLDGLSDRVTELQRHFRAGNYYYDETLASLLLAEVDAAEGREADAVVNINRVLDLSARYDYDFWLRREMRRNPALFAIDDVAERLPHDLRSELSNAKKITAESIHTSQPATKIIDLSINLLGPLDIFRDRAQPFASDAWTTRRAREIFCFIATSKHRRVAKDVLIDTFWPDEDPKAVEKNFHPTISHIRKALNSRQALKLNFLVFRDGSYQLNPDLSYLIDTEEFERRVADAEAAKREKDNEKLRLALQDAHALYRGEFMSGLYDEWAEERRTYYTEQFGRVTGALAKLSLADRRLAEAQRFASESLALDPYREDMHRLTIKILTVQGKPAAAKKHFSTMRDLLKDELGIAPSQETRRLAAELGIDP